MSGERDPPALMVRDMRTLELALRDGVRGARFVVRHIAAEPRSAAEPGEGEPRDGIRRALPGAGLLRPFARLADKVATRLARLDPTGTAGVAVAGPQRLSGIAEYLSGPPEPFARDLYAASKLLLAQTGRVNAFVSEQVLAEVHATVTKRHGETIAQARTAAMSEDGPTATSPEVVLGAAVALAIAEARPILRVDMVARDDAGPRHFADAPNLYLGCVAGVALAASGPAGEEPDEDVAAFLRRVDLVVDARFDRLKTASRAKDPLAAIAQAMVPLLRALG